MLTYFILFKFAILDKEFKVLVLKMLLRWARKFFLFFHSVYLKSMNNNVDQWIIHVFSSSNQENK